MSGPFEAEVARGIALLDERAPGWRERINLDSLNMGSCHLCVLGQVFGDYDAGFDALRFGAAIPYGFDDWDRKYEDLTVAWKRALS